MSELKTYFKDIPCINCGYRIKFKILIGHLVEEFIEEMKEKKFICENCGCRMFGETQEEAIKEQRKQFEKSRSSKRSSNWNYVNNLWEFKK